MQSGTWSRPTRSREATTAASITSGYATRTLSRLKGLNARPQGASGIDALRRELLSGLLPGFPMESTRGRHNAARQLFGSASIQLSAEMNPVKASTSDESGIARALFRSALGRVWRWSFVATRAPPASREYIPFDPAHLPRCQSIAARCTCLRCARAPCRRRTHSPLQSSPVHGDALTAIMRARHWDRWRSRSLPSEY